MVLATFDFKRCIKTYREHGLNKDKFKILLFFSRNHPQFRKQARKAPSFGSDNVDLENVGVETNEDTDQQQDMDQEEELLDFQKVKKEIFINLFAEVMKTKINHLIPNDAIDELLFALTEASNKSNAFFKKKLKEALLSHTRKWDI